MQKVFRYLVAVYLVFTYVLVLWKKGESSLEHYSQTVYYNFKI